MKLFGLIFCNLLFWQFFAVGQKTIADHRIPKELKRVTFIYDDQLKMSFELDIQSGNLIASDSVCRMIWKINPLREEKINVKNHQPPIFCYASLDREFGTTLYLDYFRGPTFLIVKDTGKYKLWTPH